MSQTALQDAEKPQIDFKPEPVPDSGDDVQPAKMEAAGAESAKIRRADFDGSKDAADKHANMGVTGREADKEGPTTRTIPSLLMITAMAGAVHCAASLGGQLKFAVDTVANRREALTALRTREYAAVVLDDAIAESDPAGAELLRKHAGAAIMLEVNFAIAGAARLAREVRSELLHREREQGIAMRLASSTIESDLRSMVAGLLLQSQLALAEPQVSPQVSSKLHQVVLLAGNLRQRLERSLSSGPVA